MTSLAKQTIKKRELKRKLLRISEGLLTTAADLILFQFHLMSATLGKSKTSRGAYQAIREADKALGEINYQTIKNSFAYLKRKGFMRVAKEGEITYAGKQRLKALLPTYQKERPWDGSIYLITYDIPEEKRWIRDQLRDLIQKLGAGYLQASVWLTPYNPAKILKDFHQQTGEIGEIIVACIGQDGYIGEESVKQLINRVYQLDQINLSYQNFIKTFGQKIKVKPQVAKWNAAVSYLAILQKDPQLPWKLLPQNWLGDKAYLLYNKIVRQS